MIQSVQLCWRKSSYSQPNNACVEFAHVPGVVAVRDSKNPAGPTLAFGVGELIGFLTSTKAGRFDG